MAARGCAKEVVSVRRNSLGLYHMSGLINATGGRRMAKHKRVCKREDESDIGAASEDPNRQIWDDSELLIKAMHELRDRAKVDVERYLSSNKSSEALANIVHDGLVSVWIRPMAEYDSIPVELETRRYLWAQS
jgi:hypothetical protein